MDLTHDTPRRAPAVPAGSLGLGEVHRAEVGQDAGTGGRIGAAQAVADSRAGAESGDQGVAAAVANVMSILRAPIPRKPQGRTAPQPASHEWKLGPLKSEAPIWAPPYHTRLIR